LNFTVNKPESWYTTNVSFYISIVCYQIDGQSVNLYQVDQDFVPWYSYPTASNSSVAGQFSVLMNDLAEGQHSLEVNLNSFSIYSITSDFTLFYDAYPLDFSKTVSFAVAENPSPSPTESSTLQPTIEPSATPSNTQEKITSILIVATIVFAAVIVALLVYFAKHKGEK
jgi:hypothetical protein